MLWPGVQPAVAVCGGALRGRVRDLVPGTQIPYPGTDLLLIRYLVTHEGTSCKPGFRIRIRMDPHCF